MSPVTLAIGKKFPFLKTIILFFFTIREVDLKTWVNFESLKPKLICDIDCEWKLSLSACKYLYGRHTYRVMFTINAVYFMEFSAELNSTEIEMIKLWKYDVLHNTVFFKFADNLT